MLMYFDCCSFV